MARIGCGCGIIEPHWHDERQGNSYAAKAREARDTAARWLENAERWEEISRRYLGGGKDCTPCDNAGGWQTPGGFDGPAGVSGWEVCSACEGFGVTRALTCYDHSEHAKGMKVRAIRRAMPRTKEAWVARRWATTQVW